MNEKEAKERMKKLETMAKPVSDFIKEYYDPHTTVVITDGNAKVVVDDIGVVIKEND